MWRICLCGLLVGSGIGAAIAPHIERDRLAARETVERDPELTHRGVMSVKATRLELIGDRVVSGGVVIDTKSFALTGEEGRQHVEAVQQMRPSDFFSTHPVLTAGYSIQSLIWDQLTTSLEFDVDPVTDATGTDADVGTYVGRATYDSLKYGHGAGAELVRFAKGGDDRVIKDRIEVEFRLAVIPNI